ncbi:MAG: class A beta-lactamase-related serine hydrolase [Dehalococcoidales bacterium]|nr:class A beta-lactamase-related serine hydrolase [Dehalococcoidales bacterium]
MRRPAHANTMALVAALLLESVALIFLASGALINEPVSPGVMVGWQTRAATVTGEQRQATASAGVAVATSPSRVTSTTVAARDLQAELADYLGDQEGLYGLALHNLTTGQTVLVNAERVFPSASIYKLLVMYEIYSRLESGALSPDDTLTITPADAVEDEPDEGLCVGETVTVSEALEAMITVSSNYAAYALVRLAGGWGLTEEAAEELGMERTGMGEEYFQTTPADMLTFLDALANGQLVSPRASEQMVALLRRQTENDRLPTLLPAEAIVAHKTGELPGARHDVGIVDAPGVRYVICMFSVGVDEGEATDVIAKLSRLVYDRYTR